MDINHLYQLKDHKDNQSLNKNIIDTIKQYFKINTKDLKKNKLFVNKNNFNFKVNYIFNKISESNVDNLLDEFFRDSIFKKKEEILIFNDIFFKKCIVGKKFIKYYVSFFIKVNFIIKDNEFFKIDNFIDILDNYITDTYIKYKNNYNEEERHNMLILIKELIDCTFFLPEFKKYFENILFNNDVFLIDIYYWINIQEQKNIYNHFINKIITEDHNRVNILLNSLLTSDKIHACNTHTHQSKKTNSNERTKIEIHNILDEYIHLKLDEEIIEYIKTNCKTLVQKNFFFQILMNYIKDYDNLHLFIDLIKNLLKNNILYKSNISSLKNLPNEIITLI